MRRPESLTEIGIGQVVHLVDRLTEDVFAFLVSTTQALADAGIPQVLVLVDEPKSLRLRPRLHDSVRVVPTPASANPLLRWWWALEALRAELKRAPTRVVQVHGVVPWAIGAWATRGSGVRIAFHDPLSNTAASKRHAGTSFAGLRRSDEDEPDAIPAASIERQIEPVFFDVPRHVHEARRPLIVTGNRINSPRSAELFAQLAVLLGGEDLGLAFNWIGIVDAGSRKRLETAGVGVFPLSGAEERAPKLAAGWVYVAAGGDPGFPMLLAEAMAVGLACVALATEEHGALIRDGETGYLWTDEAELVRIVAMLVDSRELRERIGATARAHAERRFGPGSLRDSLLAAYELPAPAPRAG